MALFGKKCGQCGLKQDVKRCPFCKKDVCESCLRPIVLKGKTPDWFLGKEVKNFLEFAKLYHEYVNIFKKRGVKLHCCNEFLKQSWSGIITQIKKYEKQTSRKVSKITLK